MHYLEKFGFGVLFAFVTFATALPASDININNSMINSNRPPSSTTTLLLPTSHFPIPYTQTSPYITEISAKFISRPELFQFLATVKDQIQGNLTLNPGASPPNNFFQYQNLHSSGELAVFTIRAFQNWRIKWQDINEVVDGYREYIVQSKRLSGDEGCPVEIGVVIEGVRVAHCWIWWFSELVGIGTERL